METNQDTSVKSKKVKLDFKDSKYATGRRTVKALKLTLKEIHIKCRY